MPATLHLAGGEKIQHLISHHFRLDTVLAFAELLVLLGLIIATSILLWRISRTAALLLVPHTVWVAFATLHAVIATADRSYMQHCRTVVSVRR